MEDPAQTLLDPRLDGAFGLGIVVPLPRAVGRPDALLIVDAETGDVDVTSGRALGREAIGPSARAEIENDAVFGAVERVTRAEGGRAGCKVSRSS
jgi:hypothetical protein